MSEKIRGIFLTHTVVLKYGIRVEYTVKAAVREAMKIF